MYDWNSNPGNMGPSPNQPFPLPNLAHPMNLPYPYPIPPGSKLMPKYPPDPIPGPPMPSPQPPSQPMPYPPSRPSHSHDFGPQPYVVDIEEATEQNPYYRRVLWTGRHLQVTLMSIEPGQDIGAEIHPHTDQFLRIEKGQGVVLIGDDPSAMTMQSRIKADDAIMIPAGKWHNIVNTGNHPLKLYSIYAPAEHPAGAVQRTKADAETKPR